jgi:hypothetical protein
MVSDGVEMNQRRDYHESNVENRKSVKENRPTKCINTTAVQFDPHAWSDTSQKYTQYQLLHLSKQSAAYFRRL